MLSNKMTMAVEETKTQTITRTKMTNITMTTLLTILIYLAKVKQRRRLYYTKNPHKLQSGKKESDKHMILPRAVTKHINNDPTFLPLPVNKSFLYALLASPSREWKCPGQQNTHSFQIRRRLYQKRVEQQV